MLHYCFFRNNDDDGNDCVLALGNLRACNAAAEFVDALVVRKSIADHIE